MGVSTSEFFEKDAMGIGAMVGGSKNSAERMKPQCGDRFLRSAILTLVVATLAFSLHLAMRTRDCTAALLVRGRGAARSSGEPESVQPFTVGDSIEMTHFVDPPEDDEAARPQYSPDGRRFFVVMEKGRLDLNLREYSLVVYNTEDLRAKPVQLAVFRSSSNRDGISQAKWLTNESIAFIGENPSETSQVHVANCRTLTIQKLTSAERGVIAYDVTGDLRTVIYTAGWNGDEAEIKSKDERGFAVTTENLWDLVSGAWRLPATVYQTFILHTFSGQLQPVQGGPFGARFWVLRPWLSPDGKYAITERPVFPIPESWESYEGWVGAEARNLRASVHSKFQFGGISEAMLVSTATGEIAPLLHAPAGSRFSVLWSSDGRSAVVGGLYLPLEGSRKEESAKRRAGAVVAEFSIPSRSFRPIAEIPKSELWFLERGTTEDTLIVRRREEFKILPRRLFRRVDAKWIEGSERYAPEEIHPVVGIAQALEQWPKLAVIDSTARQQTVITDPNPQFQHRLFGRVETIHWTGKLGEPWIGGLVYPTNYTPGARYPLVIQTHGFVPNHFLLDGSFTTAMAAQELANKGIAVLQIGETPLDEQVSQKPAEGKAYVSAYESAIDYLNELRIIDRSRVGLIGFSRTSYHVKYALEHSHYHYAAATAAEGIDFGYWQYISSVNLPIYRGAYQNMYAGVPWQANWKSWKENSISFNFDKLQTPLRLEAADNPNAILEEWETFAALRLLNKPVDLIFIPQGDHPLVKPRERMTSQQGNVDWFAFWLTGQEDSDPAKAEQYARWRELRKLQRESDGSGNEKKVPDFIACPQKTNSAGKVMGPD
jgi:hypothetical protein